MWARRTSAALGVTLLSVLTAFPQTGTEIAHTDQQDERSAAFTREELSWVISTFTSQNSAYPAAIPTQKVPQIARLNTAELAASPADQPARGSNFQPIEVTRVPKPADFNQSIYYRNKLEFSLDAGWLPVNIPFPFDFMLGDDYNTYPLKYTLVPVLASLRWQMGNVRGPWVLRGNWDLTFSGAVTVIPRGPETRYFAYLMGVRRNFVPRNWRVAPYWDGRVGMGNIDAKGPLGVPYAQGQDFTFTLNMGSGVRYNFSPRYGISAGLNWMHISNANLSQGKPPNWGLRNYGINVYGPMVGIDVRLGLHQRQSE